MSLPLRRPLESVSLERAVEDLLVRFIINVPPEDLSTVERELFHFEEALWFYIDFIKITNPHLPNLKIKQFAQTIITACPLIWKWDFKPDEALQKFSKYKKTIPVRGAAIFNDSLSKIILVKGIESDSWSFPRGKISKDENDVDCCIREVMEEIGFDLTEYIDENQYVERTIQGKNYKIFLVKGVPQEFRFKPHVRNEIEKIEWRDFKKLTRSIFKSNSKYYLVNSMIGSLALWVKKQKQINDDEHLKIYAEEQLKLLLNIKAEYSSESEDPGRELLDILHSAVQNNQLNLSKKEHPLIISTESQHQDQLQLPPQLQMFTQNTGQFPIIGFQPFTPFPCHNGVIQPVQVHPSINLEMKMSPPLLHSYNDASISSPMEVDNKLGNSKELLHLLKHPAEKKVINTQTDQFLKEGQKPSKILLDILKRSNQSYSCESDTSSYEEFESSSDNDINTKDKITLKELKRPSPVSSSSDMNILRANQYLDTATRVEHTTPKLLVKSFDRDKSKDTKKIKPKFKLLKRGETLDTFNKNPISDEKDPDVSNNGQPVGNRLLKMLNSDFSCDSDQSLPVNQHTRKDRSQPHDLLNLLKRPKETNSNINETEHPTINNSKHLLDLLKKTKSGEVSTSGTEGFLSQDVEQHVSENESSTACESSVISHISVVPSL